jgi:hypothetical protein
LYLPEIAKIRPIAQITGLTYVGDCKMAALGTRAESRVHKAYSRCPLSAKQVPHAELDRLLEPVFSGALKPIEIRLPNPEGQINEADEPVTVGFEYRVEQSTQDQSGQRQRWQARRWVVRSLAFAESQEKSLRQRVARAASGRTFPSAAGAHTSEFFFTDDNGVYFLATRDAPALVERAAGEPLDLNGILEAHRKRIRKLADGRLYIPAAEPSWKATTPGARTGRAARSSFLWAT